MPPKTAAIVAARMTSSRLPGKALVPVNGVPAIEQIVRRVRGCNRLDDVIIAMTDLTADDPLATFCETLNVSVFRGSEDDVLGRLLAAALQYDVDTILYIAGDCTAIDPLLIDELLTFYNSHSLDYASNCDRVTYPLGMNLQVFTTAALARLDKLTSNPWDREHVTEYFYTHPELFRCAFIEAPPALTRPNYRLCVDLPADVELMSALFKALDRPDRIFTTAEIIEFLDAHPEIASINQNLKHKKFMGAVVGLGQAGMEYDLDIKDGRVRCHSSAMLKLSRYKLHAACDPSPERRERFKRHFHIDAVTEDLEAMLREFEPEVLAIATPPETHLSLLQQALAAPSVQAIICEKPLALSLRDVLAAKSLGTSRGIPIVENYWMRFSPLFRSLKQLICEKTLGEPHSFVYTYSKGLWNSGSHAVNYLLYLFGAPLWVQAGTMRPLDTGDYNVDAILGFANGFTAHLICCDYRDHFTTDQLLYCERGGVRIERNGAVVTLLRAQRQSSFTQFSELVEDSLVQFDTEIGQPMMTLYKDVCAFLDGDLGELEQTLEESVLTVRTLAAIDSSARADGARIRIEEGY